MNDALEVIEESCRSLCFFVALYPSNSVGNLTISEHGSYCLTDEATSYHPLEAALFGEAAKSGDWKTDVATLLGVEALWVEGFIDGFVEAGESSTNHDYVQGYLAAEELRQRRPRLCQERHPAASNGAEFKTWLDSLQVLDAFSRGLCVQEAMLTSFVAPIPVELAFLGEGLAHLGFDHLDLSPQEQDEMLLAFVGRGVRVPGTAFRLRSWGVRAFVEAADGSEEATLPNEWRQAVLVPTAKLDGFTWIGKRVPTTKISDVDFGLYEDVGDGWIPK
jgi:hypothetical protein